METGGWLGGWVGQMLHVRRAPDRRCPSRPSVRTTDKQDRATVEQVLDPRTRRILFKLLTQSHVFRINGCISTGKEVCSCCASSGAGPCVPVLTLPAQANVYHAVTEAGEDRALKVYKTSILVFKDRDRYVSGEYRFRHGYSRHNPRQMVKVWAEKEMRNLRRCTRASRTASIGARTHRGPQAHSPSLPVCC
jgi:RIO kinase 1